MKPAILDFSFEEKHDIRIQVIDGEPWFCLKDVIEALDIPRTSDLVQVVKGVVKNDTLISRGSLDPKGITKNVTPTNGGRQALTFINEPNLYRIIFRSNKPEARQFQDWVFNVVLPAIRKDGRYDLYPDAPRVSGEPLSRQDYDRLVFLVDDLSKSFHFRKKWVAAIWHSLRRATGSSSPTPMLTTDLPAIAHEMRRIVRAAEMAQQEMRDVESEVISRVIRGGDSIESVVRTSGNNTSAEIPARFEVVLERMEQLAVSAKAILA